MLTLRGVGRYAPPIALAGFVPVSRSKYYGVGANLGMGAMLPAERARLQTLGGRRGLGAPNTESHPELVAQAQDIYARAGFSAACSEVKTPSGPGQFFYNRLCALDGGPQSHAVDPIAENYGGTLPAYMVDVIRQEVTGEKAPGSAVIVPQGVYTIDSAGKPATTSFLDALRASGVSPSVAAQVAQTAAPAPGPGTPAGGTSSGRDRATSSGGAFTASDPKARVAAAARVSGDRLTYDQWNFYHNETLGSYAPLTFEIAMPGHQRGELISIDDFWTAAYGAPRPTVPQSGIVPAGTAPAGSPGGSAGPVQAPAVAPATMDVSAVPAGSQSLVGEAGGFFSSSIFGVPVWILAAGGALLFFSGRR